MGTPTVADPDDDAGALQPSHPLLAGLIMLFGAVSLYGIAWIARQVELPNTWFGSATFGAALVCLLGLAGVRRRSIRWLLTLTIASVYIASSYSIDREDIEQFALIVVSVIVVNLAEAIWRKWQPRISGESRQSETFSRDDRLVMATFAILGSVVFTAFLFEGSSAYKQQSALESALISWVRLAANPYLVELLAILLLGPLVVAVLWKIPALKRVQVVIVALALLALSCLWNSKAWMHFDLPVWLVLGHVVACILPIAGICALTMLHQRHLERAVSVASGLWLYVWLLGPAFPAW